MQKSLGKRTSTEELLIRVIIPKPDTPPIHHSFLWRCGHTEPALRAHLTNPTAPQNRNLQFLIPPLPLFGCKNVSDCKVSARCPLPKESRTISAAPHSAPGPAARIRPRPPLSTREAIEVPRRVTESKQHGTDSSCRGVESTRQQLKVVQFSLLICGDESRLTYSAATLLTNIF